MTACDTCWGDAYARARMLGGTQVEHYYALLADRADGHTETALEQMPCERCDDLVVEVYCTHGRDLCPGHLHTCHDCQVEFAESLAYDDERDS